MSDGFFAMPQSWIDDGSISFAALGLLAEIKSHGPGYRATVDGLASGGPESPAEIRKLLKELTVAGYLVDGQIAGEPK